MCSEALSFLLFVCSIAELSANPKDPPPPHIMSRFPAAGLLLGQAKGLRVGGGGEASYRAAAAALCISGLSPVGGRILWGDGRPLPLLPSPCRISGQGRGDGRCAWAQEPFCQLSLGLAWGWMLRFNPSKMSLFGLSPHPNRHPAPGRRSFCQPGPAWELPSLVVPPAIPSPSPAGPGSHFFLLLLLLLGVVLQLLVGQMEAGHELRRGH